MVMLRAPQQAVGLAPSPWTPYTACPALPPQLVLGRCRSLCLAVNGRQPLPMSFTERCVLLEAVDLGGHVHGPTCGHRVVEHGDHYDYLVGDELHHVVSPRGACCGQKCVGELASPRVVIHGVCSEVKYRGKDITPEKRSPRTLSIVTRSDEGDTGVVISTKIYAGGICCPSEVPLIHNMLQRLPGVKQVDVAVVTKAVTVRHAPALVCPATLVAALNEAQLEASLAFPRAQLQSTRSWVPPPLTLLSLGLLLISLLHLLSGPTGVGWLKQLKWVGLGAVVVGAPPIALKAWGALKGKVLDVHMLMLIACAGAIALGDYSEAATVVVLFSLADFLENRCSGQARDAITAVLSMRPETAVLAASGREVPADDVAVGALILVKPGAKVPLDGRVERGSSTLDESMLTGEAAPATKNVGSLVSAGTVNVGGGALHVLTTAAAGDSAVARMAALVEKATSEQSPTETMVARFAKYYTPIVVVACLCLAFIPWAAGVDNHSWWVYLSLEILVTACPCALVISTPVTVVSAVARAAQMGVLIKGGTHLETLAKVRVMTFDKTGTLTLGSFRLTHVELGLDGPPAAPVGSNSGASSAEGPGSTSSSGGGSGLGPMSEGEVLRLVGSLERGASHPIAAAIVGRAAAQGVSCDAVVESSSQVAGCGLFGEVDGHSLIVGTPELLASRGVEDPDGRMGRAVTEWGPKGVTLCFVSVDCVYAGLLCAQDAPRPESAEAVRQLERLGVAAAMLTGDGRGVARAVGEATGVRPGHVHASLLPRDKLDLVAAYQQQADSHTYVAHVGDGVNDAPALAAADVGIAMGVVGSAAAVEAGDVALFSNDLCLLPALVKLSRRARLKIFENITLAVASKVVVLVLASMGRFTLWGAVLVDVGSALIVTLNGVALLYWRRKQYTHAQHAALHHPNQGCGHKHAAGSCCGHDHDHARSHAHVHNHHGKGGKCCGGEGAEEAQEQGRLLSAHHNNSSHSPRTCCGAGDKIKAAGHSHHHHHHLHSGGACCGGMTAAKGSAGAQAQCSRGQGCCGTAEMTEGHVHLEACCDLQSSPSVAHSHSHQQEHACCGDTPLVHHHDHGPTEACCGGSHVDAGHTHRVSGEVGHGHNHSAVACCGGQHRAEDKHSNQGGQATGQACSKSRGEANCCHHGHALSAAHHHHHHHHHQQQQGGVSAQGGGAGCYGHGAPHAEHEQHDVELQPHHCTGGACCDANQHAELGHGTAVGGYAPAGAESCGVDHSGGGCCSAAGQGGQQHSHGHAHH